MNGTMYVDNCTKIKWYIDSYKEQFRRYYDMKCGCGMCVWVNMGLSFCDHRRHRLHLNPQQWVGADALNCPPILAESYSRTCWAFGHTHAQTHTLNHWHAHTHTQTHTRRGMDIDIEIGYLRRKGISCFFSETNGKWWNE